MLKRFIEKMMTKYSEVIFFILPLSLFALIGFVGLYFAIKFPANVPFYGWITIAAFILMPSFLIYGFIFGFSISEKRQKEIDDRRDSLSYDENGITIEMKLFDKSCFISWTTIDAVIYYNFYVSSDFINHYVGYKFYLNEIPLYTKYEKQWWLNKIFPKDSKSSIVDIKNDTKYFSQIPEAIQKHLNSQVTIDFIDPMKGTLLSSQTYKTKNSSTTVEKWTRNNTEPEQIVYNKMNQKMEEIKRIYR